MGLAQPLLARRKPAKVDLPMGVSPYSGKDVLTRYPRRTNDAKSESMYSPDVLVGLWCSLSMGFSAVAMAINTSISPGNTILPSQPVATMLLAAILATSRLIPV
jgi:hypothetical protein